MNTNQINRKSYSYINHAQIGKICARIEGQGVLIQPKIAFQGPKWEQKLPFGGSGYCGLSAVISKDQARQLGFNVGDIIAGQTQPTQLVELQPISVIQLSPQPQLTQPQPQPALVKIEQEAKAVNDRLGQMLELSRLGWSKAEIKEALGLS